tara:strand:+ start:236 stop:514 length:279 start_codon:yes stop_codon:yes gene_type:complete
MVKCQYIIIWILFWYGCNQPAWQKQEQKKFNQECIELGLTIGQCECILGCLELEYENYSIAFDAILLDTVSTKLHTCIQTCNNIELQNINNY